MNLPPILYKYQAYSSYAIESLVQKRIWISDPKQFNDPFDCKLRLPDLDSVEQIRAACDAYKKRWNMLFNPTGDGAGHNMNFEYPEGFFNQSSEQQREMLQGHGELILDQITNVGVYSVTELSNDLLMWAHYADQHRGFVLGLDTSELPSRNVALLSVEYSSDFEEVQFEQLLDVAAGDEHLKTIAMRKGTQWAHEKEWRLVYPFHNRLETMPMKPIEVIFGHRMDATHRTTLKTLITERFEDVQFKIAEPSKTRYALELISY